MPRTLGVLVTFRRRDALAEHVAALARQTRPLDALVVIDNAPDAEVERIVGSYPRGAEYLPMEENLGPAGGLAVGQKVMLERAADEDWLVLLDDDNPPWSSEILERLLDVAVARYDADRRTAGVGVAGARLSRSGRLRALTDAQLHQDGGPWVDYLGGNQFPHYRASAVRVVGVMRSDLFFGWEELEFGLRMKRHGFRLESEPELLLATRQMWPQLREGRQPVAPWRRYYTARNGVRVLLDSVEIGPAIGFTSRQIVAAAHDLVIGERGGAVARCRGVVDGVRARMGRTLSPSSTDPLADRAQRE